MAYQDVGNDLLSILRMFTSPTMGPFSNTNVTPPFPPGSEEAKKAGQGDEDPLIPPPSTPMAYASGRTPSPVARRVIQPPKPIPAGPALRKPVLPSTPAPVAPAAPPAATDPTVPDFVASSPAYQAWAAQVAKERADAIEQQRLQLGLGGLAGAINALQGGSGSGGAAVAQAPLPSRNLSLDQFKAFQNEATALENRREALKRIPAIAAHLGVNEQDLLAMYNEDQKKFAETISEAMKTKTLEDSEGNVRERSLIGGPGGWKIVITDPVKSAKARADVNKTLAETNKTITEDEVKKLELLDEAALKAPENLARLEKVTGIPAATLATYDAKSIVEAAKQVAVSAATGQGAARTQVGAKQVEEAQKIIDTTSQTRSERAMRRRILERGAVQTGFPGAETLGGAALLFGGDTAEAEKRTREYLALSAGEVIQAGTDMKGAFSEKDRQMLQDAVAGSRNLSRDEMMRVLALRDLLDRKRIDRAITNRSRGRAVIQSPDDDIAESRPEPLQPHEMKVIDTEVLAEALQSDEGKKHLRALYGPQTADDALARPDAVIAAKLPPEVLRTYQTDDIATLKANRASLEKLNRARYGDDAAGALDLIIARREAAARR